MEAVIKEVAERLKSAIAFLEKIKVDKKFKSEKEQVLNNLKNSLQRCANTVQLDEETYDDVEVESGNKRGSTGDVYNDVACEQYDDLGPMPAPPPDQDNNIYDDNAADGLTYDDVEHGKEIKLVEFEKLKNPVIADYIELKRDRKLRSAWQKRWCALHNGIMYMYDSPKDKQQKEAFEVAGYKFNTRDDITKESKRKERCFELRNDELKKNYEFCATDKEQVTKWQAVFNMKNKGKNGSFTHGSMASLNASEGTDETYDDVGTPSHGNENDSGKAKKKGGLNLPSLDIGGLFGKKKPKTPVHNDKIAEEETYNEPGHDTYDDTANDGGMYMEYDDTGTEAPAPEPEADETYEGYEGEDASSTGNQLPPLSLNPSRGRRTSARDELPPIPSPTSHPITPPLPGRNAGSAKSQSNFSGGSLPPPLPPGRDELTGSASGTYSRRPPMPRPGEGVNKRGLPPPPGGFGDHSKQAPLPPPPIVNEEPSSEHSSDSDTGDSGFDSDDYENMYQGMWDCEPDEDNELRFKRGEIIHIISREYEDFGWWTAESRDDEVGLVPVSYLMKAYDI